MNRQVPDLATGEPAAPERKGTSMRHLLTLFDLSLSDIEQVFILAEALKKALQHGTRETRFAGRVMALLFEKPSLRHPRQLRGGLCAPGRQLDVSGQ